MTAFKCLKGLRKKKIGNAALIKEKRKKRWGVWHLINYDQWPHLRQYKVRKTPKQEHLVLSSTTFGNMKRVWT